MTKQVSVSKLEVLSEFGYSRDPFKGFLMETADSLRIKRLLKIGVESRAMISIIATYCQGKTSALDLAFQEIDATVVRLFTPDKERVVVSDIEKALILGLSNESCKRTKEVRARQIRRIIGEAALVKPVVLILEEAHRMHGQTLRALKTFRELEYHGMSPLFTVVMVGQYDPMSKRYVDEVRLRTDSVKLKGLTRDESKQYLLQTVGKSFEDDAAEAISRLEVARNFGTLQEAAINLMGRAMQHGSKKVTPVHVFEMYNGGIKELMKKARVSLEDLSKETGIPKSTLSLVTNENQGTMTDDKMSETRSAVASVLGKRLKVNIEQAEAAEVKAS
ncbi:MAG: AAA family ATPase [Nitrospirota bacterium]